MKRLKVLVACEESQTVCKALDEKLNEISDSIERFLLNLILELEIKSKNALSKTERDYYQEHLVKAREILKELQNG